MSLSHPDLPPLLATELSRQYDVVRMLGRGGMGTVWLARERSLDRLVAVKVLSGEQVEAQGIRERFRREARIAARLVHPHIVPLHAFGETPDALYFVMGYVDGETLAARLERDGRIGKQDTTRILSEIAEALAFAHREGVVHRDVKPENILLDRKSGRALLADFGVARVENAGTSVTMTGMAVGTPTYMSPEQALGVDTVDGRSDLYALGVVGYRMLAGRLPFSAASVQGLMAQHAMHRPGDLAALVPPSHQALARVIMRALEKEPTDRWARGDDMRAELESASRSTATLPDELERVQAVGTKLMAGGGIVTALYLSATMWNADWFEDPSAAIAIAVTVGTFPLTAALIAAKLARTHGWRDTLRALFNPPAGWRHWWPKSLRRLDDIWERLPKPLRRLRNVIDGVLAFVFASSALLFSLLITGGGEAGDLFLRTLQAAPGWAPPLIFVGPTVAQIAWVVAEYRRARRKLGLTTREMTELLTSPHLASDAVWSQLKYARLLEPEPGGAADPGAPAIPRTPEELARAIVALSARLRDGGLLPDDESAVAARSVQSAIASLDEEIRRLSAEIDPAELERVERRLGTVGGDADLRRLLESQRELWQRLQQRLEENQAKRERLRDQLVTLWMQLFELDARLTRGSPVDPELTGQVRVLIGEVARAGEALAEVERLTAPVSSQQRVVTPI